MPNISGNYAIYSEEKAAVKEFLTRMGYDPNKCHVERHGGDDVTDMVIMSEGDIDATLPDGRTIVFEVKQEKYQRFNKWGQLGIDFISVFHFKPGSFFDKRVHGPQDFKRFIATVDVNAPGFKWGKIKYSISDVWLFYVKNPDGTYHFIEGYDYAAVRRTGIVDFLSQNCEFSVNSKNGFQMSNRDTWESAVFLLIQKCWKITSLPQINLSSYKKSKRKVL